MQFNMKYGFDLSVIYVNVTNTFLTHHLLKWINAILSSNKRLPIIN